MQGAEPGAVAHPVAVLRQKGCCRHACAGTFAKVSTGVVRGDVVGGKALPEDADECASERSITARVVVSAVTTLAQIFRTDARLECFESSISFI